MKKQKPIFYIYAALTVAVMITIFIFSNQNESKSVAVSDSTLEWVLSEGAEWMPTSLTIFFEEKIRKVAHFLIYLLLGITSSLSLLEYSFKKERAIAKKIMWAWLLCSLYACTDEFHQLFVQGRSAQVVDVILDSVGALTGILMIRGILCIKFYALVPALIPNSLLLWWYECLRKSKGTRKEDQYKNRTSNELSCKNHIESMSRDNGYIEDQKNWRDIAYGNYDIQYCGCEIIAVYNAMRNLLKDSKLDFASMVEAFEKDGIALNGKIGTSPKAMADYLKKHGFSTALTTKNDQFDSIGESSECLILTMYNDKRDIRKEIHSIAITKEQNQYFGHNVYCDGSVIGPCGSVTDLIKNINHGNAKGIYLIGIKGPN